LFRSISYQSGESELVVLVTATLVEPLSDKAVPPLPGDLHVPPNDWEFFLQGRIEGDIWEKTSPDRGAGLNVGAFKRLRGPGAWDRHYREPSGNRSLTSPPDSTTTSLNEDPTSQSSQEDTL